MSRSYLKDKWARRRTYESGPYMHGREEHNPHRLDEMPKHRPSRFVTEHCHCDIDWLVGPGYCRGHKTRHEGHRQVSGLVRATLKVETRRVINQQCSDVIFY